MNAEQKRIFDALRGDRGFVTWEEMADEVEAMIAENARLKKAVEEATLLLAIPENTRKSFGHVEVKKKWLKEYEKEMK